MAEGDTWERKENLKNAEKLIEEFEWGGVEVKRQEGEIDEYRRMELPGKYIAKLLYGWNNQKFEEEYLNKLERNWKKWKEDRQIDESEHLRMVEEKMEEENEKIRKKDWRVSLEEKPLERGNIKIVDNGLNFYFLFFTLFHFFFFFSFLFYF